MTGQGGGPRRVGPVTKARVSAVLAALWIAAGVGIAAVEPDLPQFSIGRTLVNSTLLVAMGAIVVGFVFLAWAFQATDRV
jgi:hypothetical protein